MKVVCAPNPDALAIHADLRFSLLHASNDDAHGRVGVNLPAEVRRAGLVPTPAAWDFLAIALAAVAADHGCLRADSPDGWTRDIELHVALVEPEIWSPHADSIGQALRFLTGDIWQLVLHSGGQPPLPRTNRVRAPLLDGDVVCLLSGGMDSLVGALDLTSQSRRPVLVSQVAKGDAKKQRLFAQSIGGDCRHVQLSHATAVPGTAERSQRARSIIFLAFGMLAASSLPSRAEPLKLVVPENGFISFNVPLTPMRIGSLSTRTTHPYFLHQIQAVWDSVGFNVEINNPYQYHTKGEMLIQCKRQSALRSLLSSSTSCGRFGRFGYRHCGRCVPCMVRRAAFVKWNVSDETEYVYDNLKTESDFDDVRSLSIACQQIRELGSERWCGSAIRHQWVDDVSASLQLVERGMDELRTLLITLGVL